VGLQGRVAGQGRAITATERCAPVWARGMGREEKRPLRRRLEAQKAVGSASLVGASERLQGGSAGPKPSKLCAGVRRVTCATRALRAPGVQLCRCRCQEDASLTMPRCRRQVILPRRVVHTVDERPVVEARAPGSTCSARAVHVQCTNRAGRCMRAKGCAWARAPRAGVSPEPLLVQ
jgi:hypothetical protein